ncbi:MAG: hypothetical protein JWM95_2818 [Gemmatimonadetes bacterium]|nr:hypothetical protein [Gemmatimonadota bacterium]
MRALRLSSICLAAAAAVMALAAAPSSSHRTQLKADEEACNGVGKNCSHTSNCTLFCPNGSCCSTSEGWTYYPSET